MRIGIHILMGMPSIRQRIERYGLRTKISKETGLCPQGITCIIQNLKHEMRQLILLMAAARGIKHYGIAQNQHIAIFQGGRISILDSPTPITINPRSQSN